MEAIRSSETSVITRTTRHHVPEDGILQEIIQFSFQEDYVIPPSKPVWNEELHNVYSSSSIIRIIKSRRLRWAGHVARMGEKRNVYRLLVGKLEGKRPLGRPRRMWIDNIKMDF
jgi:hypothetical protein